MTSEGVSKIKLGELAKVRSGLVLARKESNEQTEYAYDLITLKSISEDKWIVKEQLDRYYATELLKGECLTRKGDVLIRMSRPYTAVLIDESSENYLFSSNFTIIRSDPDKIAPEYLCWLLNSKEIMDDIQKHNAGNMLGAIRSQYYAELEIKPIPLDTQKTIGRLYLLGRRENELLNRLAEEHKKLSEIITAQLYNNVGKDN